MWTPKLYVYGFEYKAKAEMQYDASQPVRAQNSHSVRRGRSNRSNLVARFKRYQESKRISDNYEQQKDLLNGAPESFGSQQLQLTIKGCLPRIITIDCDLASVANPYNLKKEAKI
ncbi:hypothetical protein HELRODRAFT_159146 [Helobdella robusta]|uniref:Uncharacterized protein n=1 Tax=Helobdella robusta TaxID=6412 RepID=T1ENN6_HELRO|nr:hypothetical protein HELRODRAFT_159146 [Helobdella robusta]ESO12585.1 hypothetical protein HELRODRAFT_159146 [Helobdella robusta]